MLSTKAVNWLSFELSQYCCDFYHGFIVFLCLFYCQHHCFSFSFSHHYSSSDHYQTDSWQLPTVESTDCSLSQGVSISMEPHLLHLGSSPLQLTVTFMLFKTQNFSVGICKIKWNLVLYIISSLSEKILTHVVVCDLWIHLLGFW